MIASASIEIIGSRNHREFGSGFTLVKILNDLPCPAAEDGLTAAGNAANR
jgi:hypothetical protein